MIKKVAVIDGKVVHIYQSEEEVELHPVPGATIEEREFEYIEGYGWRKKGFIPPTSLQDYILDLEFRLLLVELGI